MSFPIAAIELFCSAKSKVSALKVKADASVAPSCRIWLLKPSSELAAVFMPFSKPAESKPRPMVNAESCMVQSQFLDASAFSIR